MSEVEEIKEEFSRIIEMLPDGPVSQSLRAAVIKTLRLHRKHQRIIEQYYPIIEEYKMQILEQRSIFAEQIDSIVNSHKPPSAHH